ncbi:MAG: transglycosylase SLT domain-containing protein [Agitococcus sp.]|nr:transglycosylase SLT domain-containing protein [Agitococcus sp.]
MNSKNLNAHSQITTLVFYSIITLLGMLFYDKLMIGSSKVIHAVSGLIITNENAVVAPTNAAARTAPNKAETKKLFALAQILVERFKLDTELAASIVVHANNEAIAHELPLTLVLAVIAQESSFQPTALNDNDWGLMQVNAKYHSGKVAKVGGTLNLFEPKVNIKIGTAILAEYYQIAGDYWGALRRYNGLNKLNNYPDAVLARMEMFDARLEKRLLS